MKPTFTFLSISTHQKIISELWFDTFVNHLCEEILSSILIHLSLYISTMCTVIAIWFFISSAREKAISLLDRQKEKAFPSGIYNFFMKACFRKTILRDLVPKNRIFLQGSQPYTPNKRFPRKSLGIFLVYKIINSDLCVNFDLCLQVNNPTTPSFSCIILSFPMILWSVACSVSHVLNIQSHVNSITIMKNSSTMFFVFISPRFSFKFFFDFPYFCVLSNLLLVFVSWPLLMK